MNAERKEINWLKICEGRDLLQEIKELKENGKKIYEQELRKQIASEILTDKANQIPETKYY